MGELNDYMKKAIANALDGKNESMFIIDDKLVSLEIHESVNMKEEYVDLARKIENYPELKKSLQRFTTNPKMDRYSANELKELRHERRR